MSRGKQANAAAVRRDRAETESELLAGRRKIVEQQQEIEDLRGQLNDLVATYAADSNRLRTMLAACTSPEVEALRAQAVRDRADMRRMLDALQEQRSNFKKALLAFRLHFETVHDMSLREAFAAITSIGRDFIKDDDDELLDDQDRRVRSLRAAGNGGGSDPIHSKASPRAVEAMAAVATSKNRFG